MNGDMNQQQQLQQQQQQQLQQQLQQQQQQQQQQQWMAMQQYQQQWMAMQQYPPAAAMVMQQQMMYGQQYMPYYHQQQHKQFQIQQSSSEDNRTIWIGDLQQWMDEGYLHSCFAQSGEVISVKVIRNKQTGQSERYGFVEFNTHEAAEKVLQSYNGTMMPNAEQPLRLNWSAFSTGEKRADAGAGSGSDLSIFVGDLASDVTDTMLRDTFSSRYPTVKGAKVVIESNTGRSKGYGFVRFDDESERFRAMTEMNGIYCSSRAMRIGVATPKKPSAMQQYSSQGVELRHSFSAVILAGGHASNGAATQTSQSDSDLSNTTVFVGGLDSDVTDEELRQSFSQFGNVVSVKIPAGKGCGFVQFSDRSAAEDAIQKLNGAVIGTQTVRLSWGRNPANKQFRTDSGSQWNGGYYGRKNYGGYGYGASQSQDSMYAAGAAYGASSNGYGNHQQPVS